MITIIIGANARSETTKLSPYKSLTAPTRRVQAGLSDEALAQTGD